MKQRIAFMTRHGTHCSIHIDGRILTVREVSPGGRTDTYGFLLDEPDNKGASIEQRVAKLEAQLAGTTPSTLSRQNASLKDAVDAARQSAERAEQAANEAASQAEGIAGFDPADYLDLKQVEPKGIKLETANGTVSLPRVIANHVSANTISASDVLSQAQRLRERINAPSLSEQISRNQELMFRRIVQDELKRQGDA